MKDAFFKTAARALGFRLLRRAARPRLRAARGCGGRRARLRARPTRASLLIARDMPILPRGEPPRDPLFPLDDARGARRRAVRGAARARRARRAGVRRAARRRRGRAARRPQRRLSRPARSWSSPAATISSSSICARSPCRGLVAPTTLAMLGQAKAILALARAPRLLRQLRRADADRRGGLAARMRRLQGAAFSPHRSGRHHARARRRALPARPSGALSQGHVFVPRRLRRTRRDDRGGGAARNPRGGRHRLRRGRLCRLAALAVPVVADDRLPRRRRPRATSRSTAWNSRTRAGSIATRSSRCSRNAIPRACGAQPDGDRASYFAVLGGRRRGRLADGILHIIHALRTAVIAPIADLRGSLRNPVATDGPAAQRHFAGPLRDRPHKELACGVGVR